MTYKETYLRYLKRFSTRRSPMVQPCLTLIIYHFLYETSGVNDEERVEASRILKLEWNRFKEKIGKPFSEYIEDEMVYNEEAGKIKDLLKLKGELEKFYGMTQELCTSSKKEGK